MAKYRGLILPVLAISHQPLLPLLGSLDQPDPDEHQRRDDGEARVERFIEDQRPQDHRNQRIHLRIERNGRHRQVLQRARVGREPTDRAEHDQITQRERRPQC